MSIPDVSDRSLESLWSMSGRAAVVTGGASGIGRAIARRFAEAGAGVLIADLDAEAATRAAADLESGGGRSASARVDVTDPATVSAVADQAVAELGSLDVWLNVAGVYPVKPALEMTEAEWRQVVDVNLSGTFYGAREAARRMVDAGRGGVIINFHSTTAYKVPSPGLSHYIASKGGVEALTHSLAVEFGGHGIRVLAVSPTMTATEGMMAQKPMLTEAFGNVGDPHLLYGQRLPLGRIAVPDDIARVALLLASDMALIMTGSVIPADAGDLVF